MHCASFSIKVACNINVNVFEIYICTLLQDCTCSFINMYLYASLRLHSFGRWSRTWRSNNFLFVMPDSAQVNKNRSRYREARFSIILMTSSQQEMKDSSRVSPDNFAIIFRIIPLIQNKQAYVIFYIITRLFEYNDWLNQFTIYFLFNT